MNRMCLRLAVTGLLVAAFGVPVALAQTAPSLGSAGSFAVLAASTVTNTGTSIVTGDLGLSPGTSVTGFPPGVIVSGTRHVANANAVAAQNSLTAAYDNLGSQGCTQDLTGQDLGLLAPLTPGVYCFSSSAQLTGTLTLNAQGNANAVFIFKIGTTLTTASNASVQVINGGQICNVFWRVGTSATLGTGTSFAGNILANASITLNTNANVTGRLLARTAAVTLDTNNVSVSNCSSVAPPGCPTMTISPSTLPGGTRLTAYSQVISGSGGAAPITFAITAGALPTGLTLSPGGLLSGTPNTAGIFTFTVRRADANGCFVDLTYTITIASAASCPAITIAPAALSDLRVGVSSTNFATITGSGGTSPYVFTVTAGSLPPGVVLSSSGTLSGTPTTAGLFTFTVRGTDAAGCFAERSYTLAVNAASCPPLTLSPATLPNAILNTAYSQTITGSGGSAPFRFAVTAGSLPTGLTLSQAGVLSGTPTVAGPYSFTITGANAEGCLQTIAYTVVVATAVPTLPQIFVVLLTLGLMTAGYLRLRHPVRAK
jgi:hypothetical protein